MRLLGCLAAAVAMLVCAPALGGGPVGFVADLEPSNNASGGAAQILFPNIGGAACTRAVAGVLRMTPGDQDWFRITLAAGERLGVMTTPISSLPGDFTAADTVVTLLNPGLVSVAANDDAGTCVTDNEVTCYGSVIRYIAPVAGNYFLRVQGFNGSSQGQYQLALIREVPGCITWTGTSNNTPAEADILGIRQCNPMAVYCLIVAADDDYWGLDLVAGDVVSAMTIPSATAANFSLPDTAIDMVDTNGVTVLGSEDSDGAANVPASTAGSTMRFRAPSDGRYFFHVTSTSPEVDDYTFFVALVPAAQCEGDADGNGIVNFADVTAVLTNFNFICN